MQGRFAELEVRVHGRPVREYQHEGRLFIEGRKGSEFTMRVRNRCAERILAVISVDGLSVMDGEEASFGSSGYVIEPYEFMDVPGWRLDDSAVARFLFEKARGSYAARTGKALNVGVIGMAVFREAYRPIWTLRGGVYAHYQPSSFYLSMSPASFTPNGGPGVFSLTNCDAPPADVTCCAMNMQSQGDQNPSDWEPNRVALAAPDLGTGFGREAEHRVTSTTFEKRSDKPDEVLEIQYDSREGLRRRGVDVSKKPTVAHPRPFPGQRGCRPPAGWHG